MVFNNQPIIGCFKLSALKLIKMKFVAVLALIVVGICVAQAATQMWGQRTLNVWSVERLTVKASPGRGAYEQSSTVTVRQKEQNIWNLCQIK